MAEGIVIEQTGGPEVMRLAEIDRPEPGPTDLLIEVAAAGVNFIDVYFRTGTYAHDLPFVLGKEGAGRVVEVGDEVTDFAVGDTVAWAMGDGSYATHAVVPAHLAVPVPDGLDAEIAAAVMLQGMTAHYLAESIVDLAAGDTALVHAGAGGVGLLLTQLLARKGVRVLSTISSAEKAELSLGAGAAVAIDYISHDFAERVRALTDGAGVRVVFDGVGATTFEGSLDSLRPRGTLVLFGASSGPVPPFDPQILNSKGSLMLTRPSLAHFIADREELLWRAGEVLGLVASGELDVRIGARFALADAARAHEALEGRATTGKVLLTP